MKGETIIRTMRASDIKTICDEELQQGWHPNPKQYEMRLNDMLQGKSIAYIAEIDGQIAGYNNLYFKQYIGPYVSANVPEIVDLGVFERFQRLGIGTALMSAAEEKAKEYCDSVCLGVGMHSGYGAAQRLYVKRGYIPDGTGVWFRGKVCEQYAPCMNDDELILYMKKLLF